MNTEIKPKVIINIKRTNTFTVTIDAWYDGTRWCWNVYAYVYEAHKMFADDKWLKSLPFLEGCSYSSLQTYQPLKIDYKGQKVGTTKVLGLDYNHLYDDPYLPDPFDGIYWKAEQDAHKLVAALESV